MSFPKMFNFMLSVYQSGLIRMFLFMQCFQLASAIRHRHRTILTFTSVATVPASSLRFYCNVIISALDKIAYLFFRKCMRVAHPKQIIPCGYCSKNLAHISRTCCLTFS